MIPYIIKTIPRPQIYPEEILMNADNLCIMIGEDEGWYRSTIYLGPGKNFLKTVYSSEHSPEPDQSTVEGAIEQLHWFLLEILDSPAPGIGPVTLTKSIVKGIIIRLRNSLKDPSGHKDCAVVRTWEYIKQLAKDEKITAA